MAKRTKKMNSRSRLKLEALEQRQLLAGITGSGNEVLTNVVHTNGNVYDQVLMTGSTVTVTADAGQVTRVSFLDLDGDIVQAEFSGAGSLTISLANATGPAEAANYNQPGVKYVQGLASFTIQGSDSTTNFGVFTVGSGTAHNGASNPIFDGGKTGGDHTADVARLTIVANPLNPNGSTFGGIRAANAEFSAESGTVGIAAANVHVQDVVRIGDINATGTGTPTLVFGINSQFSEIAVGGGDLLSDNGKAINNNNSYLYGISLNAGTKSDGTAIVAANTLSQLSFTGANPVEAQIKTFTLTAGVDSVPGTTGDDKIVGTVSGALSALDTIEGGAGNDTLTVTDTAALTIPVTAKVSNVENAVLTSGGAINGSVSGWTGLTSLTLVGNAGAATQAITAGSGTAIKMANTVAGSGATTGGTIAITGGSSVDLTNTLTQDTVNTTTTGGAITITGGSATSSAKVTQTAAVTASATVAGIAPGAVTITDVNAASTTAAGKITTATLANYGNSTIQSNALGTLNLSGTGGTLGIEDKLTVKNVKTLNLTLDKLSGGAITDTDNKYSTLNVVTTGSDSTLANFVSGAVTALDVSGTKKLTLTSAAGLTMLETVKVSGGAGLTANFSALATVESIDASGSTAANSITLDATKATYAGGSGVDTVTVSAAPTKNISGGAGTADVLTINVAAATFSNPSANTKVSGFEILGLGANATGSYDATGFTGLTHGAVAGAVAYTNVAAGTGLSITAAPGFGATYTLQDATGTSDSLALKLTSGALLAANSVTAAGIETIAITNTDSNSTVNAGANTLTLVATSAKTVTVTGNTGLNITNTGNTSITNFDASGVTGDPLNASVLAVTFASANTTAGAAVTITGGSGNDVLTGAAGAYDTINGGAGNDTLISLGGLDILTGGSGNDSFVVNFNANGNTYATITDLTTDDSINLAGVSVGAITDATLATKVTLASTAAFADYLNAAASGNAAAATNGVVSWFQFGGDTYIVVDNNNDDAFISNVATGDQVIKLSGLIDLEDADITSEVLTLV